MKKIKAIWAVWMITVIVALQSSTAYAAEDRMIVISEGNCTVEILSTEEQERLQLEMPQNMVGGEISSPQATSDSYVPYRYTDAFNFYVDEVRVARAEIECIVWHYTDGKVHLYRRTISLSRLSNYDTTRTYGRIVNTDGSLSYTTGDRVRIMNLTNYWDFAIDFRVTPTEASFDCYQV